MTEPAQRPYTLRNIEQMLGLSRHVVTALVAAGFVAPQRGPRNEYRFSFRDVVLLRTAHALRAANIPPRRLMRSLRQLKERLPDALPLSGLRISAIGSDVAVHEAGAAWEAGSGQMLLDFEVSGGEGGSVAFMPVATVATVAAAAAVAAVATPATAFARGEQLERTDPTGAEAAYRQALALDPCHADAYVNLGALLCEHGRCDDAITLYDTAAQRCPTVALVHFNRAIALEDGGRHAAALASYDTVLALEPGLADAHFNAARLHERLGGKQAALRHLSAYRRLKR